jgi:hypothetical protein
MVRASNKSRALRPSNAAIAEALVETAELLQREGANPYRVRAYRHGAEAVRSSRQPVATILAREGQRGLQRLPGIGDSLSESIHKITRSGRLPLLERLKNDRTPAGLFTTVADIGPKLAARIRDTLGISTLTELEAAAWDGRLSRVPGMGQKRVRAVRESLGGRFKDRRPELRPGNSLPVEDQPSVELLLDLDREYFELAERDRLVRIAPRRFNPGGHAWLPILRTERHGKRYTVMFSNTSRAHERDALGDWVVIYCDDKQSGGTWTVLTSQFGPLKGERIVRGREAECGARYKKEQTKLF